MGIVAKYKFDGSVYADLIPEFNAEFTDYNITDEVEGNIITRTIESDNLPKLMRFGRSYADGESNIDSRTDSLLEVLDINTSGLTNCHSMFRYCKNLTSITCEWDTSNVNNMNSMFAHCNKLTSLDVSSFNTSNVTNMNGMFYNCSSLTSLDVSNFDTSNVTNMDSMFYYCNQLTSLDVSNFNTSKVTNISNMFHNCTNLKSLDLRNWNTIKINNMYQTFQYCSSLTTLDISNFNMDIVESSTYMLYACNNLKYLKCNNTNTINKLSTQLSSKTSDNKGKLICKSDTTNLDITTLTSLNWEVVTNPTLIAKYKYDSKIYKNLIPVFNEGYMGFVEDEEVNADGVVTRKIEHVELPTVIRFYNGVDINVSIDERHKSLIGLDFLNITNLTHLRYLVSNCRRLEYINCEEWDTSNITQLNYCFCNCVLLKDLDLNKWDTSNVTSTSYMMYNTNFRLDISNFNLNKSTSNTNTLSSNSSTDIGMIYCDKDTVNKVASLLENTTHRTIWVESDDILQYDQYDHITYKTQKVQDTVHLNSPLLKGDTIEVIDGKTYHVHRYEKIVLDGSETWTNITTYDIDNLTCFTASVSDKITGSNNGCNSPNTVISSHFNAGGYGSTMTKETICIMDAYKGIRIKIDKSRLATPDTNGLKQWLQQNNVEVIYILDTPYYELISEEPLELTLLDTTDNTINNNSILPSNMTIANKELSTIAIKPSTVYTLSFDKSIEDSEVTIDICGGEQVTTVLNRVELTTPSELGSGIRFISSDGCIVSNVRLLEGSLVEKAIPKESFEGLRSSFDDGYIIGENLVIDGEVTKSPSSIVGETRIIVSYNMNKVATKNKVYTLICNISDLEGDYKELHSSLSGGLVQAGKFKVKNGINMLRLIHNDTTYEPSNVLALYFLPGTNDFANVNNIILLEGDHTHLSEAELMRYVEKGTSHYEEEDFNHVGKYKVQYKVTGKNKFDVNTMTPVLRGYTELVSYDNGKWVLKQTGGYPGLYYNLDNVEYFKGRHWIAMCDISTTNSNSSINCQLRGLLPDGSSYYAGSGNDYFVPENAVTVQLSIIFHNKNEFLEDNIATISNIQIEEGTQTTSYEPYKSYTKIFYLNSPLLEGDTIEDINGVATHVKRYEKVILDGSEQYNENSNNKILYGIATLSNCKRPISNSVTNFVPFKCDKRVPVAADSIYLGLIGNSITISKDGLIGFSLDDKTKSEILDDLKNNPVMIVYQLASPQYESISTESILCDSYTNGHLDVDSAVPIEKVEFKAASISLKYTQPQTTYTIQFESDNIGISRWAIGQMTSVSIDVVKGTNTLELTTTSNNDNTLYNIGIGFNASNIQVVANALDDNGEVKEFDYFKGLKSSFEDGLITDENDENYGKYKVECKVVGKNLFNGNTTRGFFNTTNGFITEDKSRRWLFTDYIDVRNHDNIAISVSSVDEKNFTWLKFDSEYKYLGFSGFYNSISGTIDVSNYSYIRVRFKDTATNLQLEEGTQATEYEPYKESIHTLYLNSPLLKGDTIEVHNGKLCHYHKMGMVVLDGNKDLAYHSANGNYFYRHNINNIEGSLTTPMLSDKLIDTQDYTKMVNTNYTMYSNGSSIIFHINNDITTVNSAKQWLQANPITVVYELAEPYYEPIEPQVSQYLLPSVKDGDMEIITALPIEIDLTYRTDINGVSSIEEQIASIQESTDISSIIDEEVDE